jgi:hypothetical protein
VPEDPKNQSQDPPKEPTAEEQEEIFWTKFENRLDGWFDKKVTKYRETATSRTGRTTLPGIMANLIFGPEKDK